MPRHLWGCKKRRKHVTFHRGSSYQAIRNHEELTSTSCTSFHTTLLFTNTSTASYPQTVICHSIFNLPVFEIKSKIHQLFWCVDMGAPMFRYFIILGWSKYALLFLSIKWTLDVEFCHFSSVLSDLGNSFSRKSHNISPDLEVVK